LRDWKYHKKPIMLSLFTFLFLSSSELVFAKTLPPSDHYYMNQTRRVSLEKGNGEISFIAIGDWGSRRERQNEVAEAMGQWCSQDSNNCDFILSTGDNIYSDGVDSVDDPHFDDTWRDVYNTPGIADLPWYLTVGNHDHHTHNGEWFQVEYSLRNSRWNMPSLAFAFDMVSKDTIVKFVLIDTVSIDHDENSASDMISLLSSELEDSSHWKVVIGHYPCHSGGHYPGVHSIRKSVLPILKRNGVDFYITGHDHNQQHWVERDNAAGIDHVTTGAGGKERYHSHEDSVTENEELGMEMRHFEADYGFSYFVVKKDEIRMQFVSNYGKVIYEYVRNK